MARCSFTSLSHDGMEERCANPADGTGDLCRKHTDEWARSLAADTVAAGEIERDALAEPPIGDDLELCAAVGIALARDAELERDVVLAVESYRDMSNAQVNAAAQAMAAEVRVAELEAHAATVHRMLGRGTHDDAGTNFACAISALADVLQASRENSEAECLATARAEKAEARLAEVEAERERALTALAEVKLFIDLGKVYAAHTAGTDAMLEMVTAALAGSKFGPKSPEETCIFREKQNAVDREILAHLQSMLSRLQLVVEAARSAYETWADNEGGSHRVTTAMRCLRGALDALSSPPQGGTKEPVWLGPDRYSQATKEAHGKVIEAGLTSDLAQIDAALRHLAMMVHCDRTGELRAAHTHEPPQAKPDCAYGDGCIHADDLYKIAELIAGKRITLPTTEAGAKALQAVRELIARMASTDESSHGALDARLAGVFNGPRPEHECGAPARPPLPRTPRGGEGGEEGSADPRRARRRRANRFTGHRSGASRGKPGRLLHRLAGIRKRWDVTEKKCSVLGCRCKSVCVVGGRLRVGTHAWAQVFYELCKKHEAGHDEFHGDPNVNGASEKTKSKGPERQT